jgi:hypothetical protein
MLPENSSSLSAHLYKNLLQAVGNKPTPAGFPSYHGDKNELVRNKWYIIDFFWQCLFCAHTIAPSVL